MDSGKETYAKDYQFKLRIIDEDADELYMALGISEERAEELQNICLKAFDEYSLKTEVYQQVFDNCVHINEVTFCFEVIHHIHHVYSAKMKMQAIVEGLNKMFEDEQE
jgi:hypothetical protein